MFHKKTILIIAAILILVGAFLRLYQIGPFVTFLGDQGRDAIIVKRIVTFEHFPAIGAPSSVGQIYLGPFYYYLISPFLLLTWFNPVGLAIGVSIMSTIGLVATYFILKKHLNEKIALIFTFIASFSFILIELSRFSWNPNLLPIFTFMTFYFMYLWVTSRKMYAAMLFGAFLSFTIQLHYLALLICFPIAIYYVRELWQTKSKKQLIVQLVPAFAAFAFFSIPLVIFDLRHDFLNTNNFIKLFTEGKVSGENTYIERLSATMYGFFKFAIPFEIPTSSTWILSIILIFSSSVVAVKTKSSLLFVNAINLLFFLFGFAALNSPRHYHYYGPAYLSFYLVIAYLISFIPQKKYTSALYALLIIGFIALNIPRYYFFYQKPNDQIGYAKKIANSFKPYIKHQPIQVVTIPTTETDGHYRYFLEIDGYDLLSHDSPEQAQELYVICFTSDCKPLDDPQWQVAAFYDKQLDTSWKVENVTIYKVIHKQKP